MRAVEGISIRVEPGEIVAFLGLSGVGKTTTIDMILGPARPDGESVEIVEDTPAAAIARGLGAAFRHSGGFLKDVKVAETFRLTASLFADARAVSKVLDAAGILKGRWPPGGQVLGRGAAARAVALSLPPEPDLLILDEPTTAGSARLRRGGCS